MSTTRYFKRLPPDVRAIILQQMADHSREQPVSISEVVHILSKHHQRVELSEKALKNSIAEAALENGFGVAFDGT